MSEPPPPRPLRAQPPASGAARSRRAALRGHFQEGRRGRRGVPEPRRAGLPQLTASTAAFLRTRHGASCRSCRVPGRFTPRRPAVSLRARTALLPAAATGLWGGRRVVGVGAASSVAAALPPPSEGRRRSAQAGCRVCRFQGWPPRPCPRKGTIEDGGPASLSPPPRLGRYDSIWRLHFRDAVETKMTVFCPVAWSGPPAAIVWLPDGSSSAIFLTRNVVIRGQQRDLQGGFVCSKRAVAKRPLLNGRRAAFGGDRAGDRWQFFPHQLKKGKICIFLPTFSFRFEP